MHPSSLVLSRHRFLAALAALGALALITACGRENLATAGTDAPFRIVFVPQTGMEEQSAAAYRALQAYLAPRLGRPVEIVQVLNANAAIEGLRAGKLDMGNFSPWPYLVAEQKIGLRAILHTRAPEGVPVSYRGVLVTRAGSSIATPADLRAHAKTLVFAFEEPVSTSGHFVPCVYLHSLGIAPERDFKQVIYGLDGIGNLLAAKSGRVDVAALSDSSLKRAVQLGRIREDEFAVLWTSEPVLSTLIALRSALPADLSAQVVAALVAMPEAAPELWAVFRKNFSNPVSGFSPVPPGTLDYFREAIRTVPGLAEAS
jgi:phosphonate transport system substrate-binding protein